LVGDESCRENVAGGLPEYLLSPQLSSLHGVMSSGFGASSGVIALTEIAPADGLPCAYFGKDVPPAGKYVARLRPKFVGARARARHQAAGRVAPTDECEGASERDQDQALDRYHLTKLFRKELEEFDRECPATPVLCCSTAMACSNLQTRSQIMLARPMNVEIAQKCMQNYRTMMNEFPTIQPALPAVGR
jgi:hypothetical protein